MKDVVMTINCPYFGSIIGVGFSQDKAVIAASYALGVKIVVVGCVIISMVVSCR